MQLNMYKETKTMNNQYIVSIEYIGGDDHQSFGLFSLSEAQTFLAERASRELCDLDDGIIEDMEQRGEIEQTEDYFLLADGIEIKIISFNEK